MQLVAYSRTMASAKFKAPIKDEFVRRSVERADEERRIRARNMVTARENQIIINRQRAEANEAIRKANELLREMRGADACLSRIVRRICRAMKVTPRQINADIRTKDVVLARQAIFYWARRLSKFSYPRIGSEIGNRDHTTVMHGAKKYPEKRALMGRTLREVR